MAKFGIGQPMRRLEDPRFLTGAGRYISDVDLPRQLHALFLRSPHAHAIIRDIDATAAHAMPGVALIATGDDMKDLAGISADAGMSNRDGSDIARPLRWPLARGRVRHVGEAVAMIVADTPEQARDALEAIQIGFEQLPAIIDPVAALQPGAPLLHEDVPGNQVFDWELGDAASTAAAFAAAARVVRLPLVNNRVVVHPMEPRGALGAYDAGDGRYTLHVSSQGSHWIQRWVAETLKLPRDRLRVITNDVGGGFGMKAVSYPEYAAVLWAAKRIGRPVKWISDRAEAFLSDTQGRDHVTEAELALDAEARFIGFARDDNRQYGRAALQLRALYPDLRRRADECRRVSDSGGACVGARRDDQHRAGRGLSWRRTAGSGLYDRGAWWTRRRGRPACRPTRFAAAT